MRKIQQDDDMENYDPNMPVCNNQADFNQALRQALQYNADENIREIPTSSMYIYVIVYMIFFIWALMLAVKVNSPDRALHIALAIVFSPVYVLAYYLGGLYGAGAGGSAGRSYRSARN
jgi:hypothetical protein